MGYIKLDKNAFFNNLDYFSEICSKDKLCIALKDNAYGHGIYEIASMCYEYGIKHIFVRDLNELKIIKQFNFKFDSVLVLYSIPKIKDDNIIVAINSLDDINKVPMGSKIELKIDTGMNRNGIFPNEIKNVLDLVNENNLIINGVFTHFCCADEDNNIIFEQEKLFQNCISTIKQSIKYNFRIHCANTHGVFKVDMSKYDLARIGIGAYGYLEFKEAKYLRPVLSLYATKISTRFVKKDDHIGYGSDSFVVSDDMRISNYDVGYGDGFFRLSEDKISTIENGKSILGRVSMDSFSIEGDDDEICVFNDANKLAKIHGTINYEILTILNSSIEKRVI